MSYQDRWTRWHHKVCTNGNPSSNNGWIYSAYGNHLAPETINHDKITDCMFDCTVNFSEFRFNRSPSQITPPFSRDEAMGIISVTQSRSLYESLKKNNWNFCNFLGYKKKPLTLWSVFTAIKKLYKVRNAHRNFFWIGRLEETYPLAFRLPPQDVAYLKMMNGEATLLDKTIFYLDIINTAKRGDKSNKMIIWLKLKDLKLDKGILWKLLVKEKDWISDYFGKGHPFTRIVNEKI